jgi:hypothetical protein
MANRVFCFCVLGCFGFFLGCKSPALYEIIEVKNGSEVRDMHRSVCGGQGRQMPEVHRPYGASYRSDYNPRKTCQANSKSTATVFRSN